MAPDFVDDFLPAVLDECRDDCTFSGDGFKFARIGRHGVDIPLKILQK